MMRWNYGNGMMGWYFMFILLILIAVMIYAISRSSGHDQPNYEKRTNNSLDILNERFSRGEINEEEYKQKKTLILKR